MADFDETNRYRDGDDDLLFEMFQKDKSELRQRLSTLEPPVADDRFVLPGETRLRMVGEALDGIESKYGEDPIVGALVNQVRGAILSLNTVITQFNGGQGVRCFEAVQELAQGIAEVECREFGESQNLMDALQEESISRFRPGADQSRIRTIDALVRARSNYVHMSIRFHRAGGEIHETFASASRALDAILLAIEDPLPTIEFESTRERAKGNMEIFLQDLDLEGTSCRPTGECVKGRFEFLLVRGEFKCKIEMPGMDISEVRPDSEVYSGSAYCLYVEGSSWLWEFALQAAKRELLGEADDSE